MAVGDERVFSKKVGVFYRAPSQVQRTEGWETALQCQEAAMVMRRSKMGDMFSRSPEDLWPVVDGEGGSSPWGSRAGPPVMVCWGEFPGSPSPNTVRRGTGSTGVQGCMVGGAAGKNLDLKDEDERDTHPGEGEGVCGRRHR